MENSRQSLIQKITAQKQGEIRKKDVSKVAYQIFNVKKALKKLNKKKTNKNLEQITQQQAFQESVQFIKQVPLFQTYTVFQIKKLVYRGKLLKINYNHKVLTQGQKDQGFFIIKSGQFNVQKKINTNQQPVSQSDILQKLKHKSKQKNTLKLQINHVANQDLQAFKTPQTYKSFQIKILSKNDFFGEEELLDNEKSSSYDIICNSIEGGEAFWWPKSFFQDYITKDTQCFNTIKKIHEEKLNFMEKSQKNLDNQMNHYGEYLYQDLQQTKISQSDKNQSIKQKNQFFYNLDKTNGRLSNLESKSHQKQISFIKIKDQSDVNNNTQKKNSNNTSQKINNFFDNKSSYTNIQVQNSPTLQNQNRKLFSFSKRAKTAKQKRSPSNSTSSYMQNNKIITHINNTNTNNNKPLHDIFQNQSLKESLQTSCDEIPSNNYVVNSGIHRRVQSTKQGSQPVSSMQSSTQFYSTTTNYNYNKIQHQSLSQQQQYQQNQQDNTVNNTECSWLYKSIHSKLNKNNNKKHNISSDNSLKYQEYPNSNKKKQQNNNQIQPQQQQISNFHNFRKLQKNSQQQSIQNNKSLLKQQEFQQTTQKKMNSLQKLLNNPKEVQKSQIKEKRKQLQEIQKQQTQSLLSTLKIKSPFLDSKSFNQQLQSQIRKLQPNTDYMHQQNNSNKQNQVRNMVHQIHSMQTQLNLSQPNIQQQQQQSQYYYSFVNNNNNHTSNNKNNTISSFNQLK